MSARASSSSSVDQLDAQLRGAGGRDVRVVGDELDAERRRAAARRAGRSCRGPTTPTVLPDSSTPVKLLRFHCPLRRLASAAGMCRAAASSSAMACSAARDDVGGGRVDDHHAARGGGGHVDVVQADAGAGDDLEPGGRGQRLGVDLGGRAHEQRVGLGERREQRRAVGAVDVADLDVVAEQRDRGRARASRRAGRQGGWQRCSRRLPVRGQVRIRWSSRPRTATRARGGPRATWRCSAHRADAPIVRGQRCRAEPALTAPNGALEQVSAEHLDDGVRPGRRP